MRLEKVIRAGQIKKGDLLIIREADGINAVTAKTIVRPGSTEDSSGEEVIIHKKKNVYFITDLLIKGLSWAKECFVVKEEYPMPDMNEPYTHIKNEAADAEREKPISPE